MKKEIFKKWKTTSFFMYVVYLFSVNLFPFLKEKDCSDVWETLGFTDTEEESSTKKTFYSKLIDWVYKSIYTPRTISLIDKLVDDEWCNWVEDVQQPPKD